MERTIDLDKVKAGHAFSWGKVIKTYEIADYAIIEYHPWVYKNGCGTGMIDSEELEYSCYIGGKAIGRSADSLDAALVVCIAYKYDGCNSQAASYFMRMIGV